MPAKQTFVGHGRRFRSGAMVREGEHLSRQVITKRKTKLGINSPIPSQSHSRKSKNSTVPHIVSSFRRDAILMSAKARNSRGDKTTSDSAHSSSFPARDSPLETRPLFDFPMEFEDTQVPLNTNDTYSGRRGKTEAERLKDFLESKNTYLPELLDSQGGEVLECQWCDHKSSQAPIASNPIAEWRCMDCFSGCYACGDCFKRFHTLLPFHRTENWNGNFFVRRSLNDLGVFLHLGHRGAPCPSWKPREPDQLFNHILTVVHTNGLHDIGVRWCQCSHSPPKPIQLLRAGLYPGSHVSPESAYTFSCLDYMVLDNLETKSSVSAFMAKLRRMTNEYFPGEVKDREKELGRIQREWQFLFDLRRFGFGFGDQNGTPRLGELAYFCVACPQPGFNLPDNWQDSEDRDHYLLAVILDGNFKAYHYYRSSHNEIEIAAGTGFMVHPGWYKKYQTRARKTVFTRGSRKQTCRNHKANIGEKAAARPGTDITGIGGACCARHGLMFPCCVVNFTKGETQEGMDYCLRNSMFYGRMKELPKALCMYDIICQFFVHLISRCEKKGIPIPPFPVILKAIGVWHVHGHIRGCFNRYAPLFIPGIGVIDGEIIETLWADLNRIARNTRHMSLARRAESMNAHMNDSNFQKIINMVPTLERKHKDAKERLEVRTKAYNELIKSANQEDIRRWRDNFKAAVHSHISGEDKDAMKILDIQSSQAKGQKDAHLEIIQVNGLSEVANALEGAVEHGNKVSRVRLLSEGIHLEEESLSVQALFEDLRNSGGRATTTQMLVAEQRRARHVASVRKHRDALSRILPLETHPDEETWSTTEIGAAPKLSQTNRPSTESELHEVESEDFNTTFIPCSVLMPSNLGREFQKVHGADEIIEEEIQLRVGHANDCLHSLRSLIQQRVHMGHKLTANSQAAVSRQSGARARVADRISHAADSYRHTRRALVRLRADQDLLDRYKELKSEDLKVTAFIMNPIRHDTDKKELAKHLAWFWLLDAGADSGSWLHEYIRVGFINSRCELERAEEDLAFVESEMGCTWRGYAAHARRWASKARMELSQQTGGRRLFALSQEALWSKLAENAQKAFSEAMGRPMAPLPNEEVEDVLFCNIPCEEAGENT